MVDSLVHPMFDPIHYRVGERTIDLQTIGGRMLARCSPRLVWRFPGEAAWRQSAPRLEITQQTTNRLSFVSHVDALTAQVDMHSDDSCIWTLSGTLLNDGDRPIELARFHYLHGHIDSDLAFLELHGPRELPRLVRHGDTNPAPRQAIETLWHTMGVMWPRLADPVHDAPDWAVSVDVAAFVPDWNADGWGAGFVGPGSAFGEIGYWTHGHAPTFFIGVLLDNVLLPAGETRALAHAMVWHGDWQTGGATWVERCAHTLGVAQPPDHPLVGYCSWYQRGHHVTAQDIARATEAFGVLPVPPGGRTIQIDDGFQMTPGDWRPNAKFAHTWAQLPATIRATGSVPGLWLAPTAVHESHPLIHEHPDWLQRLPDGSCAIAFTNWGGKTYFLDLDHPDARAWMHTVLASVRGQGWRYLKLDFTYAISTARHAYARNKTSFESLRDLYGLFRAACGANVRLSACIGCPGRYALGSVNIARLGGDIAPSWASVMTTVHSLFVSMPTHGVWWHADPDVFYMRESSSMLTDEERSLLLGTHGLFGGVLLTSDFPSQWSSTAWQHVRAWWTERGLRIPAAQRVAYSPDGIARAYRVSFTDDIAPQHLVGVYNWSDTTQDSCVPLADVGLNAEQHWKLDPWPGQTPMVQLHAQAVMVAAQPPHSLRIAALRNSEMTS